MAEVKNWLETIHLSQYYTLLINAGYTSLAACATLSDEQLTQLGISLPGHQKRIIAHLPVIDTDSEVEYGNVTLPPSVTKTHHIVKSSHDVEPLLPKQSCKPPKSMGYLHMDRGSTFGNTNTPRDSFSRVDDEQSEDEQIYDIPPKRTSNPDPQSCRTSHISIAALNDEYIKPDPPPPVLPPKKRISTDDLNIRLGILDSSDMEQTEYSNTPIHKSPPMMQEVPNLKEVESSLIDTGVSVYKKKPIPKPRASIQNKRPTPVPRTKKLRQLSKSLNEITSSIPDELDETEVMHPTSDSSQSFDGVLKPMVGDEINKFEEDYEIVDDKNKSVNKNTNKSSPDIELTTEENQNFTQVQEVPNTFDNKNIKDSDSEDEYEFDVENLTVKKQVSDIEDDSDYSEADGPYPPSNLERIVIGATSEDLSKEENDNMANEMIYQDASLNLLKTNDFSNSRGKYAGVWEMKSGPSQGGVPVNEVKPTKIDTFNIPPPSFAPPPLPVQFTNTDNESLPLSPSLLDMPIAPEAPSNEGEKQPPSIPPRGISLTQSTKICPTKNISSDASNIDDGRNSRTSFSEIADKWNESVDMVENQFYNSFSGRENIESMYASAGDCETVIQEDKMPISEYAVVTEKSKRPKAEIRVKEKKVDSHQNISAPVGKKAPTPPPKVVNPFKDYYDPSRGTYCFEEDVKNFQNFAIPGWESEDTLSDGGDFFEDDEEIEQRITLRRATLNREDSIPIVSVTKNRILERSGDLYKKSSGKSAGNAIKASLRWQKRFVTFDSIDLKYYATNKSQVSKRIIPASSIINVEQDIRQGEIHPFRFTVHTIDRAYTFATDSANDLSLWTSLIMSAVLETSTDDFPEGGDMHNPTMKGFVKMDGAKGKRYLAIKGEKFCYYNTYSDFKGGCPIHAISMKLASAKDLGKNKLQLYTPNTAYSFTFDSSEDCSSWKEAFEEAIADGLGDNSVLCDVYENHSNRFCADCGAPDPHWASINLGITLCKKCAGIHRNISTPITKVRSLRMDFKVWSPVLKEMFKIIGNDHANAFWEWNAIEENQLDSDADMNIRIDYIVAKYKERRYVKYHPLKSDQEALNEALCKSVQYEDVVETMQLLFSGADILYCSNTYSSGEETSFQIAKRSNQTVQMEFLFQNGAEGSGQLPMPIPPIFVPSDPVLPSRRSITVKGHLHKTGSNIKGDFLKRWVTLEHDILSYYENENKAQAKDSIQRDEMMSVTQTIGDRFEFTFELATSKDHGRVYQFAADSEEDRTKWTVSLSRTMAPIPVKKLDSVLKCTRGGKVYIRDGLTAEYRQSWIQVEGKTLVIYNQDNGDFEDVDLRKIKNISILQTSQRCSKCQEDGNAFVIDLPERALYIQADIRKETEEWFNFIQKSSESGGTLSDQQLTIDNVPVIIEKCISHVETHGGIETEGIYRLNGQHSKVSNLLTSFQKDARSVHISPEQYIIHDVATALKRFIRGLKDPILTQNLYTRWIHTATMSEIDSKLTEYQHLMKDLPNVNQQTFEKLIHHLVKIKEKESYNKMSAVNLASIFGPIFLNTSQEAEGGNKGFGTTNKEIAVLKDILENHTFFFQIKTIDRKKEEKFLNAIKKMQDAEKNKVCNNDMILPIYVRNKDDPDVVTHKVSLDMSVQEVLSYVMKKRNLKVADNWGMYEVICNEELERPMHFTEKVLAVSLKWSKWPDEFCVDTHLCVKKNYVYEQIDNVFDSHFSLFGELLFSERKGFKKFCFEFSQYKLSYQKDQKSLVHIASWNVEDLTIYIGAQPKRKPSTKWAFTFVKNEEEVKKTRDSPFFGHSVCCNNAEELYRWIAAMYRAQYPKGLVHTGTGETEGVVSSSTSELGLETLVPTALMNMVKDPPTTHKDRHKSFFQKLRNKSK